MTADRGSVVSAPSRASALYALDVGTLWDRVRLRVERPLLELERLVGTSFDRPLTDAERLHAERLTSRLAESFRSLRLPVAVDLALQLADGVRDDRAAERPAALSAILEDIRMMLVMTGADARPQAPDAPMLFVTGQPSAFVDTVLWVASSCGLRVMHSDHGVEPAERDVDAVLIATSEHRAGVVRRSVRVAAVTYACPIFVHLESDDFSTRLAIARDVTSVLVDKAPAVVVSEIQATLRSRLADPTLAIHPSNPALSDAMTENGLHITVVETMPELLDAARSGKMHAVLVPDNVDREQRLGIPALLRSEPDTRHLPVISLAPDDDPAHVLELLHAGADEVVTTRTPLDVLAAICRQRVSRVAALASNSISEEVVSLSQAHARLVIERMLVTAYQRRSSVSVALVVLESMSDERATASADALAREFRRGDIVARWGDRQLVVALQGVGRRTAARRMEDVLRDLALANESRVGVVEYPHDGHVLEELLGAANALVLATRMDDGPRVASGDWRSGSERSADVLVVDPDATIRALMTTLFERQNLSVINLNNGVSALEYLTSARERALPRVLVMELDLVGIDGLQLLRRLRDARVLGRTRVLVVTTRIREGELSEALNLGATDIVTKPFSPALLVHRLHRVMES